MMMMMMMMINIIIIILLLLSRKMPQICSLLLNEAAHTSSKEHSYIRTLLAENTVRMRELLNIFIPCEINFLCSKTNLSLQTSTKCFNNENSHLHYIHIPS